MPAALLYDDCAFHPNLPLSYAYLLDLQLQVVPCMQTAVHRACQQTRDFCNVFQTSIP